MMLVACVIVIVYFLFTLDNTKISSKLFSCYFVWVLRKLILQANKLLVSSIKKSPQISICVV